MLCKIKSNSIYQSSKQLRWVSLSACPNAWEKNQILGAFRLKVGSIESWSGGGEGVSLGAGATTKEACCLGPNRWHRFTEETQNPDFQILFSSHLRFWSQQCLAKEHTKGLNWHMIYTSRQITNKHNMATAFLKDRKGGGGGGKTPLTILAFFPLFLSCWTAKACSTLSMETPLTIATRSFSLKRRRGRK